MDGSEDPQDWRYKRRNTVLGFWHMCKRLDWEQHKRDCAKDREHEHELELEERGDAWEPPDAHLWLDVTDFDDDIPF